MNLQPHPVVKFQRHLDKNGQNFTKDSKPGSVVSLIKRSGVSTLTNLGDSFFHYASLTGAVTVKCDSDGTLWPFGNRKPVLFRIFFPDTGAGKGQEGGHMSLFSYGFRFPDGHKVASQGHFLPRFCISAMSPHPPFFASSFVACDQKDAGCESSSSSTSTGALKIPQPGFFRFSHPCQSLLLFLKN